MTFACTEMRRSFCSIEQRFPPPDTSGGKDLAWDGATNSFGGIMQNYGGDYYFKVRSLQKSRYTGDWVQSPVRSITLTKVNGINIENASLDVTVGQAPQFNAKVAESDLSYYHIIEGWEGSDGKMITSDNAMNDRIANKISLFEDGVTYEYFIIVTAYTGYMVSDTSPVKLNGKTLDYNIPAEAADGDEIAGLPIDGGFHQAQLFNLHSVVAGAAGPAFIEIQNAEKSASSVSVTAKWDAGEATPIVCAAVYDASGRMVSMEKIENAQSTGTQAITLPLSGSLSGEQLTVKVFCGRTFLPCSRLPPLMNKRFKLRSVLKGDELMKKTRKTWSRRICGALLALCMIMELAPMAAFASNIPSPPTNLRFETVESDPKQEMYIKWDKVAPPEGYQYVEYEIERYHNGQPAYEPGVDPFLTTYTVMPFKKAVNPADGYSFRVRARGSTYLGILTRSPAPLHII